MPISTEPTSTPSPKRPTRPRSASSSSSRVRVNTSRATGPSTASRAPSRSRARSTRSAALRSTSGQASRRVAGPRRADQPAVGPRGVVAPALRARRRPRRARRSGGGRSAAARGPARRWRGPDRRPTPARRRPWPAGRPAPAAAGRAGRGATSQSRSAADDLGLPGDPLPRRGRCPATLVEDGRGGEPGEHVLAPEPAVGQGEELEQRAPGHAGGERDHGGAVGGDARGLQLLVGQAGVGLGAGVQDGDAVEPRARSHGVDDGADRSADLLVAVGRGDDRACGRRRPGDRPRRVRVPRRDLLRAGRATRRTSASASGIPVRPATTVVGTWAASAAEEGGAVAGQPLRQVDDERAELRPSRLGPDRGGGEEQVLLVGPVALRAGPGWPGAGGPPRRPARWCGPARRARRGRGPAARGRCSPARTRWQGGRRRVRTGQGRPRARRASRPPARASTPAVVPTRRARTRRAARPAGRW